MMSPTRPKLAICTLLMALLSSPMLLHAQGIVLPGIGAVNRGMGGAATAAPIDATGAIHWNPASITGLESSEVAFGLEFLFSQSQVSSTVPADSLGPGFPAATISGTTNSNSGAKLLPNVAIVYNPEDSPLSMGLSVLTIGGFGVDYASDPANPILTAQPPGGFGIGPAYSRLGILQMGVTVAYELDERWSIGAAPTVTAADLQLGPYLGAAPDDANGDGFPTYPNAFNSRMFWGGGFQVGVFRKGDNGWNVGLSYKSKQWFDTFEFNSLDELGRPQRLTASTEFPQIVSMGLAYVGHPKWVLACDVRYTDFDGIGIFGDPAGFDPTGRGTGLGWDSTWTIIFGSQYKLSDMLTVRGGYLYTQSPIDDADSIANIQSPSVYNHGVSIGASILLTSVLSADVTYVHAFDRPVTGPISSAAGTIPGSSVTNSQVNDSAVIGMTVKF